MSISACVHKKAIAKFGKKHQIDIAIEELAELIVALNHFKRNRQGSRQEITEEIADVEIMIAQLKLIFDNGNEIDEIKQNKIIRLNNRIGGNIHDM